jgi:TrmH family RNA methyltransferase
VAALDVPTITSRQNPLVKKIQEIRDDRDSPYIFIEGSKLIQEALTSQLPIEILISRLPLTEVPFSQQAQESYYVSESVFDAMTDVKNPQALLAIVRRPLWSWDDLRKRAPAPVVILSGLQDPGNTAAIIRTAEAAGAAGVLTTSGTAHLFSPKALRGAMGSTLRLPSIEHRSVEEITRELKGIGYAMVGTTVLKNKAQVYAYTDLDWKKPWALILGQEGQGLSKEWQSEIETFVHIPMVSPVESLNVAATAAILLYESVRQRL